MFSPRSSTPALLIALVLSFQLTYAQQPGSASNTQSAEAELRGKAFELLESLANQLGTLQSAENRARMGSNIAASLWAHDEKRARALFKVVEDDIKFGLQVDRSPDLDHTFQVFYKLREDNAERLAQLDPEMALTFVRETYPLVDRFAALPSGGLLPLVAQKEQELNLRLAKRIGASNPEIAVTLARQSLANGFSTDLLAVLRKAGKGKAQALAFYKEIVTRLGEADFENWRTVEFAESLVRSYPPPAVDESTFRELIHIILTKMFGLGCDKRSFEHDERIGFCSQLGFVVPLMEKFYPAETRPLKRWVPQDGSGVAFRQGYAELNETAETGTIDEVLSLTSQYPDLDAPIRYRAMVMAEAAGDWERAEKIANSVNADPETRQRLDERVRYYKNQGTSAEQEWTEAQKNLKNLPLKVRTDLLLNLAHNIALRDRKTAVKALAELSGLIEMLPPGKEQTEHQITIATIYCLAKSDRGFGIMEGLLPKLNELIAAGAKLDGYDSRYLRDGEWNMTAEGNVGNLLTILANNAVYFAWSDFDRAVNLASQFERSEIRMMAQLKLAQGILAGPPTRRRTDSYRVIH